MFIIEARIRHRVVARICNVLKVWTVAVIMMKNEIVEERRMWPLARFPQSSDQSTGIAKAPEVTMVVLVSCSIALEYLVGYRSD